MPEEPTEQNTNWSEERITAALTQITPELEKIFDEIKSSPLGAIIQSQPRIRPITGAYNRDLMMKDMGGWASDVPEYDPEKPIPLHPNDENIGMPSSGDPERDQRDLAQFRRSQCRLAEGLCPNGCGPIVDGDEPNSRRCPICKFVHTTITLHVGSSHDAD